MKRKKTIKNLTGITDTADGCKTLRKLQRNFRTLTSAYEKSLEYLFSQISQSDVDQFHDGQNS